MSQSHVSIPDDVKQLHRRLSDRQVRFLEAVEAGRSRLGTFVEESRLPAWHTTYQYRVQSWPTFVAGARLQEIRGATVGLARILKKVPEVVFDRDPQRLARFYGIDEPMVVYALLQEPDGLHEALVRGDFIDSEKGFKCVEFNTTACLGGWQIHFYVDSLLATSPISELRGSGAAEARFVDPVEVLFHHLTEHAQASGVVGPEERFHVVILVKSFVEGGTENPVGLREYLERCFTEVSRRSGVRVKPSLQVLERHELRLERSRLFTKDGRRIHALIEYQVPERDPELFRAFKGGWLNLYNSPLMWLVGDKRNLALLHENADSERFTAEERRCIRDHVPATALVAPEVTWRGERRRLADLVREERRDLVLKHAFGARGEDLFLGWKTPETRWDEAVGQALESGLWILQERLESRPYWYVGPDGVPGPHELVWGLFAFGDHYGGGFLRMAPVGGSGIINSAQGASEGLLLEIENDDE